jgi:hypothetical protein
MLRVTFVHGVAVRDGDDYGSTVRSRDQLFKTIAFANTPIDIRNAYWGKNASRPAWDGKSLPRFADKATSFALLGGLNPPANAAGSRTVSEVARSDFGTAIDALFVAVVETAEKENRALTAEELKGFAAAGAYAQANPKPAWLQPGMSDADFVDALKKQFPPGTMSFGIKDYLFGAATSLVGKARNLVSTGLTATFRDDLNPLVARFLGDVLVYVKKGNQREAIRTDIANELLAAQAAKAPGDKLVAVGHSMGGVILVDMLSDPASALKDIEVDLLLTVGSQPGYFEEMKLFTTSRDDTGTGKPVPKAPKPPNVKRWWNVYDPVDLLSFRCDPIFDGVEDFSFSSATGLMDAHTSYFKRPKFHQRLNARAIEDGLLP